MKTILAFFGWFILGVIMAKAFGAWTLSFWVVGIIIMIIVNYNNKN